MKLRNLNRNETFEVIATANGGYFNEVVVQPGSGLGKYRLHGEGYYNKKTGEFAFNSNRRSGISFSYQGNEGHYW